MSAAAPIPTPRATKSATAPRVSANEPAKPRVLPDPEKVNKSMANLMTIFTNTNNKSGRVALYKPTTTATSTAMNSNINLRKATTTTASSIDLARTTQNPLMNTQRMEANTKMALNALLFSTKDP